MKKPTLNDTEWETEDAAQPVERLLSTHKATPTAWQCGKAGGYGTYSGSGGRRIGIQGHPWLPRELEGSLGYMRPCVIKTNTKKQTSKQKAIFFTLQAEWPQMIFS